MKEYILKIDGIFSGERLDLVLMRFSKENDLGFSRTFLQKLIKEGKVQSGGINLKPHYKVRQDEEIKILLDEKKETGPNAEEIPLEVVYEDEDVAVINKQAGLVVHPAPGNYEHTLVNALLSRFKNLSDINPQRPGIVHRLDKDTSGLLVIAKNNAAHLSLTQQFAEHTISKIYVALVQGRVEFDEHTIEVPIGRHPYKRKDMAVGFNKNTKYAKTCYKTIKRGDEFSFVELKPLTGRTHQLRVHLAFLGHPILGDTKYGKNNFFPRLALHAKSLGFHHPKTGKFLEFSSKIPEEFKSWIDKIR